MKQVKQVGWQPSTFGCQLFHWKLTFLSWSLPFTLLKTVTYSFITFGDDFPSHHQAVLRWSFPGGFKLIASILGKGSSSPTKRQLRKHCVFTAVRETGWEIPVHGWKKIVSPVKHLSKFSWNRRTKSYLLKRFYYSQLASWEKSLGWTNPFNKVPLGIHLWSDSWSPRSFPKQDLGSWILEIMWIPICLVNWTLHEFLAELLHSSLDPKKPP